MWGDEQGWLHSFNSQRRVGDIPVQQVVAWVTGKLPCKRVKVKVMRMNASRQFSILQSQHLTTERFNFLYKWRNRHKLIIKMGAYSEWWKSILGYLVIVLIALFLQCNGANRVELYLCMPMDFMYRIYSSKHIYMYSTIRSEAVILFSCATSSAPLGLLQCYCGASGRFSSYSR